MQQAHDFLTECEILAALLEQLSDADWLRRTQFKDWTVNDVVAHLHFWNLAADRSLKDPEAFGELMAEILPEIPKRGMRAVENARVPERGAALFDAWREQYRDMGPRWAALDPKIRVKWAGPDMSARSCITARQMETWAHGQEVFDLMGRAQPQDDRIRNIVVLGVNTFGWAHKVRDIDAPSAMPELRLTSPSGAVWSFGEPGEGELIEGSAEEFAQVVTQTRNMEDTALRVTGPVATRWMRIAQCFAGPPETPPGKGRRFRAENPITLGKGTS